MTQSIVSQSLYDLDLNLWAATTVAQLQARQFDEVDWDAVIEEIEALSKRVDTPTPEGSGILGS